ncbi:putative quinol monooxygenase [Halobacteriales archaeon Cl-PHB]
MFVVHAKVPLDPDHHEDALELIEWLAEETRDEPGCVDYRATLEISDEPVVHFIELYEDRTAREAHGETDHYQEFESALPTINEGEIVVREFEAAGEPEVARFDI